MNGSMYLRGKEMYEHTKSALIIAFLFFEEMQSSMYVRVCSQTHLALPCARCGLRQIPLNF